jgi:hypothetical protein
MTEEVNEDRLNLLRMVEKLAGIAAKAEADAVEAKKQAASSASAMNYWLGESNKANSRVKELEQRVHELSSPLADLARAVTKEQA